MVSDTGEIQPERRLNCCLECHGDTVKFTMTANLVAARVLAHQGGWDEILWVLVPITVMVGLLGVATRRVRKNPPKGATPDESDSRDIGAE